MPFSQHRWPLTSSLVADAPDEPGVFAVWENDELVYIGHAKRRTGLRAALTEHLQDRVPCTREATHYAWRISLNPEKTERDVLADYYRERGMLPRCNRLEA